MNVRDPQNAVQAAMPDVQGSADTRDLPIQRVGIKGVRYPLVWRSSEGELQSSVGDFNLYVALPGTQKGTHMSRFVELLEARTAQGASGLDVAAMLDAHAEMIRRLEATSGRLEVRFPFFVRKTAPVSGVQSLLDYEVSVSVDGGERPRATLSVLVPVKSLCPCSKSISDFGAHNQRSHVTMHVVSHDMVTPQELIRVAEQEASSEIFGLLKRVDEKYVTERAYENPKFVEDLVRDVAARLKSDPRIESFSVEAENFESIHNHSAYARIDWPEHD